MKRLWVVVPLIFSASPAWAAPAATVVNTVGQVILKRSGEGDSILKVGQSVLVGDVITTAPASAAKLLLADQTILDIAASSFFRVEEFEGEDEDRQVKVGVDLGSARASVNRKLGKKGRFLMKTKSSVIAVRGTEFVVYTDVQESGSRVAVLEGQVEFSPVSGAASPPVLVGSGRMLVQRGGAVEVVALSREQIRQITERMRLEDQTFRQLVVLESGGAGGVAGSSPQGRGTLGYISTNLALPTGKAARPEDILTPGTFSALETLNPNQAYPAATPINIRVVVGP